jgi:hypothetical protein
LKKVEVAYSENRCSVRQAHSPGCIAYLSFVGSRRTIKVHVAKPFVTEKDFSVRTQHFHVPIEQKARLRMAVIILVQEEATIRREVEQTLHCFQVFDFSVVKLIAQLPILEEASSADVDSKHSSENSDRPKREPVADVPGTEPH